MVSETKTGLNLNIKLILTALLVILLLGGIFVYKGKNNKNQLVSNRFVGAVTKVENGVIYANGVFEADGHPELNKEENRKEVAISVNSSTSIRRSVVVLPTMDEVKDSKGWYNYNDLKHEDSQATMDNLSEDLKISSIMIKVTSNKNIFMKQKIEPETIEYSFSREP